MYFEAEPIEALVLSAYVKQMTSVSLLSKMMVQTPVEAEAVEITAY